MPAPVTYLAPRSREQLISRGAGALTDPELIALFIGTGCPGRNCLQVSADLLRDAGSLRELLLMLPSAVRRTPGLGPARYARLQSALELARRARLAMDTSAASEAAQVRGLLIAAVTDLPGQSFAAAFLGDEGKCLACEHMFQGTLRFVHVHPREVVRRALSLHATRICVARGDPEGEPLPAPSDHALRAQLSTALELVGIRLEEYYIVGQSCEWIGLSDAQMSAHANGPRTPQQLPLDLRYPPAERIPESHPAFE